MSKKQQQINFCAIPANIDPRKLYITGFDRSMKLEKLKLLFPAAIDVQLPLRKANNTPCGYGTFCYSRFEIDNRIENPSDDRFLILGPIQDTFLLCSPWLENNNCVFKIDAVRDWEFHLFATLSDCAPLTEIWGILFPIVKLSLHQLAQLRK